MNATLSRISSAGKEAEEEHGILIKAQRAALIRDIAEERVTKSDEDVLLEMQQIGLTAVELEREVARHLEVVQKKKDRLEGAEALRELSSLGEKKRLLMENYDRELKVAKAKYFEEIATIDHQLALAHSKQLRGANADVWLRENLQDEIKPQIAAIERERKELLEQRRQLLMRREQANVSGMSDAGRKQIVQDDAQIEARLKELAEKQREIEEAVIA